MVCKYIIRIRIRHDSTLYPHDWLSKSSTHVAQLFIHRTARATANFIERTEKYVCNTDRKMLNAVGLLLGTHI
jgi:hypothetical protein